MSGKGNDISTFCHIKAIPPNGTYTYCMFIEENESGTHMYHAHTAFNLIWLHGSLTVLDRLPLYFNNGQGIRTLAYDEERTLILEELVHVPIEQFSQSLVDPTVARPTASSLLINGQSYGV